MYLVKELCLNYLLNVVCSCITNADFLHSWRFFLLLLTHTHARTHTQCTCILLNVLLTVRLGIILVINQLNAQNLVL